VTAAEVFDGIYARRVWGDGSGGGSDPGIAAPWCRFVEDYIHGNCIWRVLDIGCGDGRLARAIDWDGTRYTGIDCSRQALDMHPKHDVRLGDALTCELPDAEVVLLKEVTQHLPNADVIRLMGRLTRYRRILHCSGIGGPANGEIEMGGSRYVDLAAPPFSLPAKEVLRYGDYVCQLIEW